MPCARHTQQGTPESRAKEAGSARRPHPGTTDHPPPRCLAAHHAVRTARSAGNPRIGEETRDQTPGTSLGLDGPLPAATHEDGNARADLPRATDQPPLRCPAAHHAVRTARSAGNPRIGEETRDQTPGTSLGLDGPLPAATHEDGNARADLPRATDQPPLRCPAAHHAVRTARSAGNPRIGEETRDQTPGTSLGSAGPLPTATREDANARADSTTGPRTTRDLDAPLHTMPCARHTQQGTPESRAKEAGSARRRPPRAQPAHPPRADSPPTRTPTAVGPPIARTTWCTRRT